MNLILQLFNLEPVYFIIASIATVVFIFKLLLLMVAGIAKDIDFSSEVDHDTHSGADTSFSFFTTQTLLSFFMGMGWLTLALRVEFHLSHFQASFLGIGFGIVMMLFTAFLTKSIYRLNKIPNYSKESLLGLKGSVYLTIPAMGEGEGQVEIVYQGSKKIIKAFSRGLEPIPSFTDVVVTDIQDHHLIVKKAE